MADIYQVRGSIGDTGNGSRIEVKREDIEAAIAKSVEFRAHHAAVIQGNSPVKLRFDLASPVSCNASQFSAQDYPVFTPVSIHLLTLFSLFVDFDFSTFRHIILPFFLMKLSFLTLRLLSSTQSTESKTLML